MILGIYYDKLTSSIAAQIVRDLLAVSREYEFSVLDTGGKFEKSLLQELGIPFAETGKPELAVVYKEGEAWPAYPEDTTLVKRDLMISKKKQTLSTENKIGYFLKPQGRVGPNLTERYLNRAYPKGKGFIDPALYWMY